jgi:hypothetical protein
MPLPLLALGAETAESRVLSQPLLLLEHLPPPAMSLSTQHLLVLEPRPRLLVQDLARVSQLPSLSPKRLQPSL